MDDQLDEGAESERRGRASRRQVLAGMGLIGAAGATGALGLSAASAGAAGAAELSHGDPSWSTTAGPSGSGDVGTSAFPTDNPILTYQVVSAYNFSPQNFAQGKGFTNIAGAYGVYCPTAAGFMLAPLVLPTGASIREYSATVVNTSGSAQSMGFESYNAASGALAGLISSNLSFPSQAGVQTLTSPLTTPHTVTTSETFDAFGLCPTGGTFIIVGARVGYVDPAPGFHPISPTRVYDSRWSPAPAGVTTGPIGLGGSRVIATANGRDLGTGAVNASNIVPNGATAVTYNLTAIGQSAGGFLAITAGGSSTYAASAINWNTAGEVVANGGVVPLDLSRQVKVFGGAGTADFIIDITGYYK